MRSRSITGAAFAAIVLASTTTLASQDPVSPGKATPAERSHAYERLENSERNYRRTMADLRRLRSLVVKHEGAARAEDIDELIATFESRHELQQRGMRDALSDAERAAWQARLDRHARKSEALGTRQSERSALHSMGRDAGTQRDELNSSALEDVEASTRIDRGNMKRTLTSLKRKLETAHRRFVQRNPQQRQALEQSTRKRLQAMRSGKSQPSRRAMSGAQASKDGQRGRDRTNRTARDADRNRMAGAETQRPTRSAKPASAKRQRQATVSRSSERKAPSTKRITSRSKTTSAPTSAPTSATGSVPTSITSSKSKVDSAPRTKSTTNTKDQTGSAAPRTR